MLRLTALAALLSATSVLADTAGPQCSLDKKCPKESPCCSRKLHMHTPARQRPHLMKLI